MSHAIVPGTRRRLLLTGLAAAGPAALLFLASGRRTVRAEDLTVRTMKTPGCGCCEGWAEHLRAAGFACEVVERADLDAEKDALGVPADLRACHTALLAGYVIEGHVPALALRRLLAERPRIAGLAVPGMPAGSPGMPSPEPEAYDVLAFARDGTAAAAAAPATPFMRFVGERPA